MSYIINFSIHFEARGCRKYGLTNCVSIIKAKLLIFHCHKARAVSIRLQKIEEQANYIAPLD